MRIPKQKHGRGGQSAVRFARLRLEKRHNYLRKVAETATQLFITNDRPNVAGLVLAGSADFKTELGASDLFDPRLAAKVIASLDIAYGGESGFNQAIELAADCLQGVKFVQEKKLINRFFEEIHQGISLSLSPKHKKKKRRKILIVFVCTDTNKYVFGMADTLKALELGAVETLIVWENLDIVRYQLRNSVSGGASSGFLFVHVLTENVSQISHVVTGLQRRVSSS